MLAVTFVFETHPGINWMRSQSFFQNEIKEKTAQNSKKIKIVFLLRRKKFPLTLFLYNRSEVKLLIFPFGMLRMHDLDIMLGKFPKLVG